MKLITKWAKRISKDTLLIKNLPPELTDTEKKDLLTHFGAVSTKILTSKYQQKSNAYVRFDSEETAKNVLLRLHQMNILGSRLSIEYAKEEVNFDKFQNATITDVQDDNKYFNMFLNKLNSWNVAVSFHQPAPPHLKYLYPKPNRATINNIAHALASVPKFYTQVLHLMNKMNLPPPFSNIPDPPEHNFQPQVIPQQIEAENSIPNSTSESELESDPDEQKIKNIIPAKRTKPQKKLVKKPKFIKPALTVPTGKTSQNTAEVFDVVDLQNQKRIEVRMSETLPPTNVTEEEEIESFGIIPSQKCEKTDSEINNEAEKDTSTQQSKVISELELASNRISPKDFGVLSVFKNYHAGAPSCRIYLKNLSKNVELKDLEYIYKRYEIPHDDKQGNMFDIRLMQEGRMKGQCFVTLQNVGQAQKAVKETNGYILKNKPLVVVFARSAVPKTK